MLKSAVRYCSIAPMLMVLVISSCNTFDPPIVVPAYGHIDSIHFAVTSDTQGSSSHKIPYTWVYLDDNPVGAFQMPCTFPMVTSNGVHNIKIYSGIIPANGGYPAAISPFYQFYSTNVTLKQGVTTNFQPSATYYNWVDFPYLENFEENSALPTGFVKSTGIQHSDTNMYITHVASQVFEGRGSGMVIVDASRPNYVGMTSPPVILPVNSSNSVYMELNYKATTLFSIGLYEGDTNYISPLVVYQSPAWNKMYVVLQNTLATFPLQPDRIYFALSLDVADGHTSDTLLIDNVKILK